MVLLVEDRVGGALMDRDDLIQIYRMLMLMERLGLFKFEMDQGEVWRGGGYFWPYS